MTGRHVRRTVGLAITGVALLCLAGAAHAGRAVYKTEEIAAARVNVVKQAYGKTILEALLKEANRWVEMPDEKLRDLLRPVTPKGSGTTCPMDGAMLECKMDDPWGLICRKCEARYPNAKYPDEGMGCKVGGKTYYLMGRCNAAHIGTLTGAAHDMALAYALTGKIDYAQKTAVILARVGEVYPGFARHDGEDRDAFGGGKATSSTQTESGWLKVTVAAYELIREAKDAAGNPVITTDRRTLIEGGLLKPAAQLLMETKYGMHSIQAAQNAAVAAVGVCLDEPDYVHFAVDGASGFRNMLANGVLDDGMCHEGAMGYHVYAVSCLLQLAHYTKGYSDPAGVAWSDRPGHYEDLNLEETPALKRMMAAINRSVLPDGNVPALNDSASSGGIGDSQALAATHRLSDQWGAGMEWTAFRQLMQWEDYARLFRKDQTFAKYEAGPPTAMAYDLSGFGLAVLKSEAGAKSNVVALDHSMQLNEHTHPDLLQLLMLVDGRAEASDWGSIAPLRGGKLGLLATTVAHNTVLVDRADQVRDVVPALVGLDASGPVRTAEVDARWAYKQCPEYRRAVLMMGRDYVLDVFRVTGGTRFEYAFHADGKMTVRGLDHVKQLTKAVGSETGVRELKGFQKGSTKGDFEVTWSRGKTPCLRLMMSGDGPTTVRFGPASVCPADMILAERGPGLRQFVSVIEPLTGLPKVKRTKVLEQRWNGGVDKPAIVAEVEGENWIDRIGYTPAGKTTPGNWSLARAQQGHMKLLYCTNGATATATGWVLKSGEAAVGITGQVVFRDGSPEVLLDIPVVWGKASRELDVVFGEAGARVSRYKVERLTPVGNAVWATLAKEPGICLSRMRVDEVNPVTRRIDSDIPAPRRLELRGKAVVRGEDSYFSTLTGMKVLVPGWSGWSADGTNPPEAPVRAYFNGDGDLGQLRHAQTLSVMDITLHTPVRVESTALLEETGPDAYRLRAPLGASVTIPTPYRETRILWAQADGNWQEIKAETSPVGSGPSYLMTVEFPIEALAEGPIEFRLVAGK